MTESLQGGTGRQLGLWVRMACVSERCEAICSRLTPRTMGKACMSEDRAASLYRGLSAKYHPGEATRSSRFYKNSCPGPGNIQSTPRTNLVRTDLLQ